MEDFNINNTSQEKSHSTVFSDNTEYVVTCIITAIGLPSTLVAIYALYSLARNDQVAPIYVINLHISDLIHLCCSIVLVASPQDWRIIVTAYFIEDFSLMANVCFMVCLALERYLVIAHPLWYHFGRTVKKSVVGCVLVWVLTLVYFIKFILVHEFEVWGFNVQIISVIFFLFPLPLFIFLLGGTLKALSVSRVPSDEKRQIVGTLVLLLLIYMLLFIPFVIAQLVPGATYNDTLRNLCFIFVKLKPLADLTLYVFMVKGAIEKLLASVCCCRMDSNDINSSLE